MRETMPTVIKQFLALALLLSFTPILPAQAQELDWAQKMFEKQRHDFGVVARGSDVRYRLKIKNLYKQTVHISGVRTTCGCTAAEPSKNTLASRETAYVELTMNTKRFTRQKDSNVIITFDQPRYAEVRIPVSAYIRTDVVLTPGGANFGGAEYGKDATKNISIAYAGREDWKVKSVKVNSPHLDAKVVETSRGGGRVAYQLELTLKKSAPVGNLRELITLVTDDVSRPHIPVLIEARVEPDVTVTPSLVSLGMMVPGKAKTVNVVIRGKKAIKVDKIECESDRNCFKIRLPEIARTVHVLPLTVTPPAESGEFTEEFTVTIAGRDEPVHFKAYGKIAE
jgi:hypothetical protein